MLPSTSKQLGKSSISKVKSETRLVKFRENKVSKEEIDVKGTFLQDNEVCLYISK